MKPLHFPGIAASLVMFFHAGSHAIDERRGSPGNVGTGIENCVSVDWIYFGKNDRSVTLDAADHRLVRAEMIRRYPVIETDGFPSSRTILWQRQSGELLYIAVIDNPAKPSESCFTATFSAERFDMTLLIRSKYLAPVEAGK